MLASSQVAAAPLPALNAPTGKAASLEAVALGPGAVAESEAVESGDAWLDEAVLTAAEVDEEALAVAMAEDELADMTSEELAQLEAGLVLGEDSDDPDEEHAQ
jgi:hypothetical protein